MSEGLNDGQRVASALREAFTTDEEENVVGGLYAIARMLNRLGLADASTPFGALESVSKEMHDGSQRIAEALGDVASALSRIADAIEDGRS